MGENGVGKWLSATGQESDIVISTRIRLARNLTDVPFLPKTKRDEQEQVVEAVRLSLAESGYTEKGRFVEDEGLADDQGQFLLERHLVSPDFVSSKARRGLYVSNDETVSLMINEEDHLRFQVLASGLAFAEALAGAVELDDRLENQLKFAYSPQFGFLTACPSNVGTGMRASVLVHLPALVLTREIEKVLRGALHIGLAVRGLYGEGTETRGNFFQISNQKTVGQDEDEIVETISGICRQVVDKLRMELEDKVFRSFAILKSARILSSDEAINLIATLRLGVALGIVNEINLADVSRLLILVRPANLQAMLGEKMETARRDERRAAFVRETLVR
jgi:protein arginine kinase